MANRTNNIWAKAAAGSPGTNIARAQQSRWTGVPNERIMLADQPSFWGLTPFGGAESPRDECAGAGAKCGHDALTVRGGVGISTSMVERG